MTFANRSTDPNFNDLRNKERNNLNQCDHSVTEGSPQRVCATSPSVHARGVFSGDLRAAESPRQPVGLPPESGPSVSLTGRPRGLWKIGSAAGTQGPPHPLPVRVGKVGSD